MCRIDGFWRPILAVGRSCCSCLPGGLVTAAQNLAQTPPTPHRARPLYCTWHCPQERWGEAARRLAGVLNDDTFRSIEGKSKHQLWLELCDLITKHPADVLKEGIDVDAILRGGIRKYKDEVRAGGAVLCCAVRLRARHHSDCDWGRPQLWCFRGGCGCHTVFLSSPSPP